MAFCQIIRRLYFQVVLVMGVGEIASAQEIVNMPDITKRPSAQSTQLDADPQIDGEVLQDEVWKTVTPIDELWQPKLSIHPYLFENASFRFTVVRT